MASTEFWGNPFSICQVSWTYWVMRLRRVERPVKELGPAQQSEAEGQQNYIISSLTHSIPPVRFTTKPCSPRI